MATSTPVNPSGAFAPVPSAGTPNKAYIVPVGNRLGQSWLNHANLTLANGMTAGYGIPSDIQANPTHVNNPVAYPGTYGGNPKWPVQRVGVMRNVPGSLPSGKTYGLYFIFNPNQIQTYFETNPGQIPAVYIYGGSANQPGSIAGQNLGVPVPNLSNQQTVAWSLIFDRTYDMLYGDERTNPELNRGVFRDTAALYNLMGTFAADNNLSAVPMATPVEVIFGQTEKQPGVGQGQLWGFTGFISSVNITYGIFRHNMIPSRAEVDLTMTAVYVSQTVPGTGAISSLQATSGGSSGGGSGNSLTPAAAAQIGNSSRNAFNGAPLGVKYTGSGTGVIGVNG